jgi:hypothetical protein
MRFKEIVAAYCENHRKQILCVDGMQILFNVTANGAYTYHCVLTVELTYLNLVHVA